MSLPSANAGDRAGGSDSPEPSSEKGSWAGVVALACAAFIVNTTEFAPIGLLTGIGQSFGLSPARAGLMLTVYAWVVALTSLPCILLARHVERRKLLLGIFGLFIACHALSAVAWSFEVLLLSRVGVALSHAVFWAITAALVVRIAPEGKSAQALGLLATGTSVALVLGLPLGRFVGEWLSWRATLAGIGVLAAVVALALWRLLPPLPSRNAGTLASVPLLLKRPALMSVYLLTMLMVAAHFTANTYVEPFAQQVAQLPSAWVTALLLLLGGAGLLGATVFGRSHGRHPNAMLVAGIGGMCASLLLLLPVATLPWLLGLLAVVWGASMMMFALSAQARVLAQAADATDVAMAIFSGIFNVGIGAGALIGSQTTQHLGVQYVGLAGFAIGLAGLLWACLVVVRAR